jgi:hypothetical protein
MCGKGVGGCIWCQCCVYRKVRPVETISGMGEGG